MRSKYTDVKKVNLDHMTHRERQANEYSQLMKTMRDKEHEVEEAKMLQERLEKSLKESVADKMKSIMQKNREKEEV